MTRERVTRERGQTPGEGRVNDEQGNIGTENGMSIIKLLRRNRPIIV